MFSNDNDVVAKPIYACIFVVAHALLVSCMHSAVFGYVKSAGRGVYVHTAKTFYHWLVSIDQTVSLSHPWLLVEFVRTQHLSLWFCRSIIYKWCTAHCLTEMAKNNWQALFRAIHTCTNQSQCTRLEWLWNAKSQLTLHSHCETWSVHSYHGNNLWWVMACFLCCCPHVHNVHCRFQHWKSLKIATLINAEVDNTRCHKIA